MQSQSKDGKKAIGTDNTINMNDPETIKKLVQERVAAERSAIEELKPPGKPDQDGRKPPYSMKDGYYCRSKPSKDGDISIRLANFEAEITEENLHDNGVEATCFYQVEGKLHGKIPLQKLEVPAAAFGGMAWVSRWGCQGMHRGWSVY